MASKKRKLKRATKRGAPKRKRSGGPAEVGLVAETMVHILERLDAIDAQLNLVLPNPVLDRLQTLGESVLQRLQDLSLVPPPPSDDDEGLAAKLLDDDVADSGEID